MYTFNTVKKRLEPSETKCLYCHVDHSVDMEDNYFIPLFKEQDRTNIIVYSSVKFSKIPVGIPRCKTCKSIHSRSFIMGAWIAWICALLFVIIIFKIWGVYGIFGIIAGVFLGAFGTGFVTKKLVHTKNIPTQHDGALQSEAVQELVLSGWSLVQPMA